MGICVLLGLLASIWTGVDATCANFCSGHGTCGGANKCTCFPGWTGAPDCSRKVCPTGTAWADKASGTNVAHSAMECSNRGVCDYSTGVCMCTTGFTGNACQRRVCLNNCSGHGTCQTMAMMGLMYGPDVGTGKGPAYTNWEQSSMMSCFCDYGYQGPDCSLRMCPKNDDPLTTGQGYRTVSLTLAASTALAGSVTFTFSGQSVTMPANSDANSNAICTAAISSLPNIGAATCTMSNINGVTKGINSNCVCTYL
uniref:Secreted protein n=1 Tax=Thraustotheca clavata TaxID=74557 RepID=A0A0A7CM32_9STRA|nr:secreted protein [Thraustotheca clavata]